MHQLRRLAMAQAQPKGHQAEARACTDECTDVYTHIARMYVYWLMQVVVVKHKKEQPHQARVNLGLLNRTLKSSLS